jgi:FMN phosphatase YigB (HAD superfamily)
MVNDPYSRNSISDDYFTFEQHHAPPRVVLIDLFDTILGRRVEPEYVKLMWAKRLKLATGLGTSVSELHKMRVAIEAELCSANLDRGFDDEFRHLEMCQALFKRLNASGDLPSHITSAAFHHLGEALELALEREVQFVYEGSRELLEHLQQKGIPVYIVSDTFYSTRAIRSLLQHHGILRLVTGLFLSSEVLVTKRRGRLYSQVLSALNLEPGRCLMLGDNRFSDIESSGLHGIPSILVEHGIGAECRVNEQISEQRLKTFVSTQLGRPANDFSDLAFSLHAFIGRLYQEVGRQNLNDILFCSREGLLLKTLFEQYQEQLGVPSKIRTHYFYTSRLSSFMPSLRPLAEEHFERLFRQYIHLSIRSFLLNLQFREEIIIELAEALEISPDQVIQDLPRSEVFANLIKLPQFTANYEEIRATQRELALEYIRGFFPSRALPKVITLVDVGWKGTIQDNLRELVPEDTLVQGLYLGLVAPGAISERNIKKGLLFSVVPGKSRYFGVFAECCALFEIFLSAQHPGVVCYARDSGASQEVSVVPVFGQEEKTPEVKNKLESLQKGLVHACRSLFDEFKLSPKDEIEDLGLIAELHFRLAFTPSEAELRLVASLEHFENFGLFSDSKFDISEGIDFSTRFKALIKLVKEPRSLLHSTLWPTLSLVKHGLNPLVPVYARFKASKVFN